MGKLLKAMSEIMQVNKDSLLLYSKSCTFRYKEYQIRKKNGGTRTVYQPSKRVKFLQKVLVKMLFDNCSTHRKAFAYQKNKGIKDIASIHVKNKYMLRLDFCNFFSSITSSHIIKSLEEISPIFNELDQEDFELISYITCRKNVLCMGAPSSPIISNIYMNIFDENIDSLCEKKGAIYSRYADDIFISTNKPHILKEIEKSIYLFISEHHLYSNLKVNKEKTLHTSTKGRRMVTGIIITPEKKLSIGRNKKRIIKSKIFKYIHNKLNSDEVNQLAGEISFAEYIEPSFLETISRKFGTSTVVKIKKIQKN